MVLHLKFKAGSILWGPGASDWPLLLVSVNVAKLSFNLVVHSETTPDNFAVNKKAAKTLYDAYKMPLGDRPVIKRYILYLWSSTSLWVHMPKGKITVKPPSNEMQVTRYEGSEY